MPSTASRRWCVSTNRLDENPFNLDRQDFRTPDWSFLTHLHNGHTAPESDGNPNYSMNYGPKHHGYLPQMSVDNLYLNWPAGGDDREKQSFFWFHDHRMDHTGSNVYKGMVGLYPIHDPKNGMDVGDERQGLRLPGVRHDYVDGSFEVDYDIPLAFSDFRLDDGVTIHKDIHDTQGEFPAAGNPRTHPEWWGKTFYKHFPNHGFVGDLFTVNGTAYPVLALSRRKYRFRFLDASVSRIYEFKLMSSTQGPRASKDLGYQGDELEGQYRIPDAQQCMRFTQIASDGGLLPFPITRDSSELWPAKRRECIIDFTRYQDGSPTTKGDVVYLTDIMKMPNGRMCSKSSRFAPDLNYKVPVLKFAIGDIAPDNSVMPAPNQLLRDIPPLLHPFHLHMEEHRTVMRNGNDVTKGGALAPAALAPGRLSVPWSTVLPLAVVLAYADGFWMTPLRGAIGAIERTQSPFSSWWRESTLVLPMYVLAVLAALTLAVRWFGAVLRSPRAVLATVALIVAASTVVGLIEIIVSSAYDYHLQSLQMRLMDSMHTMCTTKTCLAQQEHDTLAIHIRGVLHISRWPALTNLALVLWLVAMRGGRLKAGSIRARRARDGNRINDLRLLLMATLIGAAVIHAAVIPDHLREWGAAGAFFILLTTAELAVAALLLTHAQHRSVLLAAGAISIVPLVVWLWSRAIGMPFGPDAGIPEAIGLPDVVACTLEVAALIGAIMLLSVTTSLAQRPRATAHATGLAVIALVAVTTLGLTGTQTGFFNAFTATVVAQTGTHVHH